MKEISISELLQIMSQENNYADDIWKTCLDKKGKRHKRKDITNSLKKLQVLGFIKKIKISSMDVYYNKLQYSNPEDYLGFVNDIMFSNESKIKDALRRLTDRKIFVDISKNINSYKLAKNTKNDYEKLLESLSNMTELSSAIQLVMDTKISEKVKNQLNICKDEIKETVEQTKQKIIVNRKSNEIILLERGFAGRIPNPGYLKL